SLVQRQTARCANVAHAGELFEAVNEVPEENSLRCLCFGILGPGKRNVHGDNFVHAEAGIEFEDFEQAAPEQAGTDDEDERDGDLPRDDGPANALAALRAGLTAPAFLEASAQVT